MNRERPQLRRRRAAGGVPIPAIAVTGLCCAVIGVLSPAEAAPNPYGDSSETVQLDISADGTYSVQLRQEQELVSGYELQFGGALHDGFRLADGKGRGMPPYLRADYRLDSFSINGEQVEVEPNRIGHRVELLAPRRTFATGVHSAEIAYTVSGAAIADGEDAYVVHHRPLGAIPDTVLITVPEGATVTGVECLTVPPESRPCGRADGDGWLVDAQPDAEGILAISVDGSSGDLVDPVIDEA